MRLAQRLSASKGTAQITCDDCDEDAAAFFCVACDMYFCADCLRCGAKGKGKKKGHEVRTVADHSRMAGPGTSGSTTKPMCRIHNKPLELFCETCDQALCVQCSLDHKAPKCRTGMVEDLVGKNSQQLNG